MGDWGEQKALELLRRPESGFVNARDVNAENPSHRFGDLYAERGPVRFFIRVKTRNRYQVSGLLNPAYNLKRRGAGVGAIARWYRAIPAFIAISVIPEEQRVTAYFGTLDQIEGRGERFSIPMTREKTVTYELLGREDEFDPAIRREWSNRGYENHLRRNHASCRLVSHAPTSAGSLLPQ